MLGRMNNLMMKDVFKVPRCTVSEKKIGAEGSIESVINMMLPKIT